MEKCETASKRHVHWCPAGSLVPERRFSHTTVVIKLTVCSYVNQQGFFCLWKRGETASGELILTAAVTEHAEEPQAS